MQISVLLKLPRVFHSLCALKQAQVRLSDNGLKWLEEKMNLPDKGEIVDRPGRKTENLEYAANWHEAIRLAARLPLWKRQNIPACLPKALALHKLLLAHGMPAVLCLGVSKRGRQLASHAWVELYDQMVGEPANVAEEFVKVNARAWPRQAVGKN